MPPVIITVMVIRGRIRDGMLGDVKPVNQHLVSDSSTLINWILK